MIDFPEAAYLHIPFCRRRCFYCDFPISVVGNRLRGESSGMVAAYVALLKQEIAATPVLGGALQTVFFGGGTPSLLAVSQLSEILEALDQRFGLAATAEISLEMDPGTFDLSHIQGYRALGVNRVSLGVQAFQDELLVNCGRFHRVIDIERAIEWVHTAAIPCWSLDLISGLPDQSLAQWEASLQAAIATHPPHLSIYDLTIEPQTPFGRFYTPGIAPLPPEATTVEMFRCAQQTLTAAGYEHYEISNYAQPGYQCQHNRTYWENRSYYGFGMGATSYTQQQRFGRPRTRREYQVWLETYRANGGQLDCVPTPPLEQLHDQIMLGLRLREGIALTSLVEFLGGAMLTTITKALQPYLEKGTVKLSANRLQLSDPEGFLISNTVIASLFAILDRPRKPVVPCSET